MKRIYPFTVLLFNFFFFAYSVLVMRWLFSFVHKQQTCTMYDFGGGSTKKKEEAVL